MKHLYLLLFCFIFLSVKAQWQWYDPQASSYPVVQNQGWTSEAEHPYARLPMRAKADVRKALWDLSRNSAGLSIRFYSNAPQIKVRYTVGDRLNGSYSMPHMPATGVSGTDLYSTDSNGKKHFCFGSYSFGDTISYTYNITEKSPFHNYGFEYDLYLPLYNSVTWMEIGVPQGSDFTFIPLPQEKPIVLYGTSIAQGACASRPGMAWGNILQRSLGYPLINLGFSGNGKLEAGVLKYIAEQDARLYILDCMPNIYDKIEQEVSDLVTQAVRQIRQTRTAPILIVEHAGYSNADTDSLRHNLYTLNNRGQHKAFDQLVHEGVKDIYYLSHDDINIPADGWVDYVHPSDYGMITQAQAVEKKVREILHLPAGPVSTTVAVSQRREPQNYEWQKRHQDILSLNKNNPPKAVIIGNSITHFWGGEPVSRHCNGADSWDKVMRKQGFHNLGFGFDRIENVLWRVYHDELSGYKAQNIVLMIGTNNLGINSDSEITEGLRFLLSAIRTRQPEARIKVVGILPRRADEARIKNLNEHIHAMATEEGYMYCNAGTPLLQKDGKINESLFLDGLHPNAKGYQLIAGELASF